MAHFSNISKEFLLSAFKSKRFSNKKLPFHNLHVFYIIPNTKGSMVRSKKWIVLIKYSE